MIQLQGAGKRFGHKLLFENCDWLILPKERTGLVGGNGTGKSTILKILSGTESLDYGSITVPKNIRLGYLPQDGLSLSGRTVFAECMTVFADLREMEVEDGTPLYDIADLSSVWVEAQVYEADQSLLREGLKVQATTLGLPGRVFTGKLDFVYPHLDEASRTLTVRYHLPNPDHPHPSHCASPVRQQPMKGRT